MKPKTRRSVKCAGNDYYAKLYRESGRQLEAVRQMTRALKRLEAAWARQARNAGRGRASA